MGRTALLRACDLSQSVSHRFERYAALDLIQGGADIYATDNTGLTALHYAVKRNITPIVTELLTRLTSVTNIDNFGNSPPSYSLDLRHILHARHVEDYPHIHPRVVESLLDSGADALATSQDGRTAIHHLIPYLMIQSSTRERTGNGSPDLDDFAFFNRLYNRFVAAGCNREARDSEGNTPLFLYVATLKIIDVYETYYPPNPDDQLRIFMEHDIKAVNFNGDTLLHAVAKREIHGGQSGVPTFENLNLFKMLVDLGLDPRQENKRRITPLE